MNELEALVVLTSIPFLGPVKIKTLIETFGSSLNALSKDPAIIEGMRGFGTRIAHGFRTWQDNATWKETLSLSKKYGVEVISYASSNYPISLLNIDDHPLVLYVLGDLKKTDHSSVAVVGTRQASIYGLEMAERISSELAEKGLTVVSGLARGIDTAAHIGALRKGRTIAVIGSGLSNIYPKENLKLAEDIAKNGAVISEFPMMAPPEKQNFPRRNRIISGMSLGTLLIEAPSCNSGSMITMEKAISQKKQLFAIPGRIDTGNFQGNHLLIKSRSAELVENASDICKSLRGFENVNLLGSTTKNNCLSLSENERGFFESLPIEEFTIEEALQLTKLPVAKLNVLLMSLMLNKALKEYPGKMYKKIGRV